LTSLITQEAGRHEQGVVLGLTQSMTSIASIVAPIVAGLFIEHAHLLAWALLAAALSGVGGLLTRGHQAAAVA
jgi:MFS family permease